MHLPFCSVRCRYCSFVSVPAAGQDIPAYCARVRAEARERAQMLGGPAATMYLGGGTPTVVPEPLLRELVEEIGGRFGLPENAEITVEANPLTIDRQLAGRLLASGVTRVSLGVQATTLRELILLGRGHRTEDAERAAGAIREAGLQLNCDLMYGLPGQTERDWAGTLEKIVGWEPEHLSLYPLEVHDDTPFGRYCAVLTPPLPSDDVVADQFLLARQYLGRDYIHYELSNWCRPGRECQHNLTYWRNGEYVGLGAAAHSHLLVPHLPSPYPSWARGIRRWHGRDPQAYVQGREQDAGYEWRSAEGEAVDAVVMGLRLRDGVDLGALRVSGCDPDALFSPDLSELIRAGLLIRSGDRVRLAAEAWFIANQALARLVR